MPLRSLLFVPGDRPDRMEKALTAGADALILDLEDSVSPSQKARARDHVAAFLSRPERPVQLFVRVNALDSAHITSDLQAVAGHAPDGIMLPKAEGGAAVAALAESLAALGNFGARILPIALETPAAVFGLGSYTGCSPRLTGLTWGAEDLPSAIGAQSARESDGTYTAPYQMVRALALFAAHAAGVAAIETVYPDIRDLDGLAGYAKRGARDGFTGMMAIHPAQIPAINAAFTPSANAVAQARAIVAAFEANPDAGALQLDGKMIDTPHLKRARRLLEQA